MFLMCWIRVSWTTEGVIFAKPLANLWNTLYLKPFKHIPGAMLKMSQVPSDPRNFIHIAELHIQMACQCAYFMFFLNSLWPSDIMWRHRSGSTLAQVMACCLTAPSHYLAPSVIFSHFSQFTEHCLPATSYLSIMCVIWKSILWQDQKCP